MKKSKNEEEDNILNNSKNYLFNSILEESPLINNKEINKIKNALKECGRIFTPIVESTRESYQCSDYSKSYIEISDSESDEYNEINNLIIKNQKCVFEYVDIKKQSKKYVLFAKTNICKNKPLFEVTGNLILCNELKLKKYVKKDTYIQVIPFYQTKNKLRDRVLLTNQISNIIVFINKIANGHTKTNCSFFLFSDNKKICHLLVKSIKPIKKGDLLYINEEEFKLRI